MRLTVKIKVLGLERFACRLVVRVVLKPLVRSGTTRGVQFTYVSSDIRVLQGLVHREALLRVKSLRIENEHLSADQTPTEDHHYSPGSSSGNRLRPRMRWEEPAERQLPAGGCMDIVPQPATGDHVDFFQHRRPNHVQDQVPLITVLAPKGEGPSAD